MYLRNAANIGVLIIKERVSGNILVFNDGNGNLMLPDP